LLLQWYEKNARQLPWRNHPDPYAVWVSEIMLQQTRVDTVIPYFQRWMAAFPSLAVLAATDQQAVLKIWEGLGYYSRARNIQKAAQVIVLEYDGQMPKNRAYLEKLPGIGKYTAGAIASMAFGEDEAALDGNIRRVLARIFNVSIPARSPQGEKQLWQLAEENLPPGKAGDYNQAMMDLGSSICLPKKPLCDQCPVQNYCQSYALQVMEDRPVLPKKEKIPHYIVTAAIFRNQNQVLIAQRPPDGMLGNLWEFPGGKLENNETLPEGLQREIYEELGCRIKVGEPFGIYKHAFTHFRITLHAFFCEIIAGDPAALSATRIVWVDIPRLDDYPMGKVDRQISARLLKSTYSSL
jgi:A/G-specific adenine glycosylase